MKSFVLTPNGVKVRVPGFAEMRAEMEHGEAFCRRAVQALEQLEMGAPQMGR